MDGHAIGGIEGIDEGMCAMPIPFCVPPQGLERNGQLPWGCFVNEGCAKVTRFHGLFLAPGPNERKEVTDRHV